MDPTAMNGTGSTDRHGPAGREGGPPRPLVVARRDDLLDDLLRLAAAAGVSCEVVPDLAAARASWSSAPLVLIDDEAMDDGSVPSLRRDDVVLIARSPDEDGVWQRAVGIGARHVVVLPDAEPWLVERLTDLRDGPVRPATVVGVVGGRGGAGASTLAAALAVTGVARDASTLLVDLDPLGGGIDLALGLEGASGLRWADLARARGRINGVAMRDALPRAGRLPVLAWDRADDDVVPLEAARSVCEAAARSCELVVVDLPRGGGDAAAFVASRADEVLVVVPAEVRAVASAERVLRRYRPFARRVRVVVRGPAPGGLSAAAVCEALGVELAGELKPERGLDLALERGEAPAARGRGPLASFCATWLDGVARG